MPTNPLIDFVSITRQIDYQMSFWWSISGCPLYEVPLYLEATYYANFNAQIIFKSKKTHFNKFKKFEQSWLNQYKFLVKSNNWLSGRQFWLYVASRYVSSVT